MNVWETVLALVLIWLGLSVLLTPFIGLWLHARSPLTEGKEPLTVSKNNYPLGRPPKVAKAVVADYQPARRTCLGVNCGKVFMSNGPGHRICPPCARKVVVAPRRAQNMLDH